MEDEDFDVLKITLMDNGNIKIVRRRGGWLNYIATTFDGIEMADGWDHNRRFELTMQSKRKLYIVFIFECLKNIYD